jgi:hypothetical protein
VGLWVVVISGIIFIVEEFKIDKVNYNCSLPSWLTSSWDAFSQQPKSINRSEKKNVDFVLVL